MEQPPIHAAKPVPTAIIWVQKSSHVTFMRNIRMEDRSIGPTRKGLIAVKHILRQPSSISNPLFPRPAPRFHPIRLRVITEAPCRQQRLLLSLHNFFEEPSSPFPLKIIDFAPLRVIVMVLLSHDRISDRHPQSLPLPRTLRSLALVRNRPSPP